MLFFLIICKGKKSRSLKIPSPLLYYLSKTSYKQEHAELCKALIDRENYDVNYAQPEAGLSLFLEREYTQMTENHIALHSQKCFLEW
ncbi:hypothetical protein X975_16602, partial [Stegodyphus mimosarum]